MPTYQYACTNADCGNRFELVQSFTDPAASTCPVCGSAVRKVFSSVGVVFKGSGFYRNDSRAAADKGSSGSGGSDASKSTAASSDSAATGSTSSSGDSGSSGSKSSGSNGSAGSGSSSSGGSSAVAAAS